MTRKCLLIALLITLSISIAPFSYTFTATANNVYKIPSYTLGSLAANAIIQIKIQLVYTGQTIGNSLLLMSIRDSSNNNILTFDGSTASQTLTCSLSTCSVNWTVPSAGTYLIRVAPGNSMAHLSRLIPYYLTASAVNQTFLQVTDVVR